MTTSAVYARNLVATSQPLAVESGIHMLRLGGNAVDAALAAAITLTVVEPNNNGIGSDAFALIHDGKQLHGLNASGRSPAGLTADRFKDLDRMPVWGWEAVTVPGAVSAWVALSEKFGQLPFETLFKDAVNYARDGFQVGPKSAYYWDLTVRRFKKYGPFMDTFSIDGRAPAAGERMILSDHADTLEEIAASSGESFYRGELAARIAADAKANNATMTEADLAEHKCNWVDPIHMDAFGASLHEIPPNGQGLMALISLGILKHRFDELASDSVDSLHLQIESQRIAYAEMERQLADPDFMSWSISDLLDSDRLKAHADSINMIQANPSPVALGAGQDTVYLTTADENGMMVSFIQSNYRGFGSGIVVPGTGISLQNRGSGFVLEDGHPNQVGPRKRPYHTIIPGFITQDSQPAVSFGVMGGHMQAQGHLQMMIRLMRDQQDPQAASDAPRWYVHEDGKLSLEDGMDPALIRGLKDRGHDIQLGDAEHLFGGAQLIRKLPDGYVGGSDHRKEGLVSGF